MRVGLLGGSFNPAHAGHLYASLVALARLKLDQVWWLVTPHNPLKPLAGMAPHDARLASARAEARHPAIRVGDPERTLGANFTADTLAALRNRYPSTRFVWIMGADNLNQICSWRRWTRIYAMVPIAVVGRSPYSLRALNAKAARRFQAARLKSSALGALAGHAPPVWGFLMVRPHPGSATRIRAAAGRSR